MSSTRKHRKATLDSVSSPKGGDPATRQRICEAALRLIVKRGGAHVPLTDVAKAARVSRQALYLHFKDRAALFLAVAQHADEKRGLPDAIRRLEEAPTGLDAVRHMAATRATLNPEIWPLARILDSVRRQDPAAEITVQNRLAKRLGSCRMIVEQLNRDGSLRAELEPTVAADLLWVLTSLRSWEDLVLVRGWTAAQYEERIVAALLRLLTNSPAADRSGFSKRSDAVSSQRR
jgi:AcrR family transcriptional regulator